jgi:hypothetical protein
LLPLSATPASPLSPSAPTMDFWFIVFDYNKPLSQWFMETLPPHKRIIHLMKKITGSDYDGPTANVKISDMEVWKFRSLKLVDPFDEQMERLLNNLNFTDNEDSEVELVDVRTTMEMLQLASIEPLLVRQKGKHHVPY